MSWLKFDDDPALQRLRQKLDQEPTAELVVELHDEYQDVDLTAELLYGLANACRDPDWRVPLQQAGFLNKALRISLADAIRRNELLATQLLRYLCNSVADTDDNRRLVLPHLIEVYNARKAGDKIISRSALSTIINLCRDYEPAQHDFIHHGLFDSLQHEIQLHQESGNDTGRQYFRMYLQLLVLHLPEFHKTGRSFPQALAVLVFKNVASFSATQGYFTTSVSHFFQFTKDETIKTIYAEHERVDQHLRWTDILDACARRLQQIRFDIKYKEGFQDVEDLEDDMEELIATFDGLVAVLADVAAQWQFKDEEDLHENPTINVLRERLAQQVDFYGPDRQPGLAREIRLARAAALVIGNVVKKDWIASALAPDTGLFKLATHVILGSDDRELLNALSGMLRNLGMPSVSKGALRESHFFEAVQKLLSSLVDGSLDIDICLGGLRLLRVALLDCPENCYCFWEGQTELRESLESLMKIVPGDGSSTNVLDARISAEIGKILVGSLRTSAANSKDASTAVDLTSVSIRIADLPGAAEAISGLTLHPDPRNKSQGWFGLAMLSGSEKGAVRTYESLGRPSPLRTAESRQSRSKILESRFKDILEIAPSPEWRTLQQDQGNALVVVAQLISLAGRVVSTEELAILKGLLPTDPASSSRT